ncbi:hypothetical protein C8R45DRAFT_1099297 [Mycena sanguinolenta]|nr:hypothetical protein C8R45DRAFT_1099297 [Mycena sanguinolenta]
MCRVGNWNLSYASLTSPEALAGLRNLRTTNPTLHAAQTSAMDLAVVEGAEEAYANREVYDDCDVPPSIVSVHLSAHGSSVETNFVVSNDGGITRSGNAEASEDDMPPPVLGRGQRKRVPTRRYWGPHALRSNTKPASFLRDRVQHLFVRDLDDTQLEEILSVCTEIQSLVLFQSAGPRILAALGATRVRWLNLDLKGLLQGMDPQSLHPIFTFVTHLDLFDSLHRGPHVAHLIDHLSLFPALTHLVFFHGNREATQVFSRCRKLEALIGFYTLLPDPRHLGSIDDLRFVTMNVSDDDYVMEWVIGTRGGWDFWARADAFIQKRIKEILILENPVLEGITSCGFHNTNSLDEPTSKSRAGDFAPIPSL